MPMTSGLDSLYAVLTDETQDIDSRLDHIFSWSDEHLWSAKWLEIDDMISYAPYSELGSAVSVGMLLSVRSARDRFPHWDSALLRLEESLLTQGLEDTEVTEILGCLRSPPPLPSSVDSYAS